MPWPRWVDGERGCPSRRRTRLRCAWHRRERRPDITSLDDASRNDLAALLTDVLGRLDRLYDEPLPYMLWLDQRPTDGGEWPTAWFHIEIVSPWRRAGTLRHIAAAEVAGGEFFNPVIPEDVAAQLRALA